MCSVLIWFEPYRTQVATVGERSRKGLLTHKLVHGCESLLFFLRDLAILLSVLTRWALGNGQLDREFSFIASLRVQHNTAMISDGAKF